MTNEEAMQILTDMGLHKGGMDNWVADNAWWKFANVVAEYERTKLQGQIETLYAMYELAIKQRDYLMEQQNAQVAEMRGKMQ